MNNYKEYIGLCNFKCEDSYYYVNKILSIVEDGEAVYINTALCTFSLTKEPLLEDALPYIYTGTNYLRFDKEESLSKEGLIKYLASFNRDNISTYKIVEDVFAQALEFIISSLEEKGVIPHVSKDSSNESK